MKYVSESLADLAICSLDEQSRRRVFQLWSSIAVKAALETLRQHGVDFSDDEYGDAEQAAYVALMAHAKGQR